MNIMDFFFFGLAQGKYIIGDCCLIEDLDDMDLVLFDMKGRKPIA